MCPGPACQEGDELGAFVVAALHQPAPGLAQLRHRDRLRLLPARRLEHRALPEQRQSASLQQLRSVFGEIGSLRHARDNVRY